jgi:predicted DNA-binding transcriptional regulator AlpA
MVREFDFPLRQQLTTPLAARYLGLATDTLMSWRKRGHGPRFLRYGRTIRYDQGELDVWKAMHVQEPRCYRDVTPSRQTADVVHIHSKRLMACK